MSLPRRVALFSINVLLGVIGLVGQLSMFSYMAVGVIRLRYFWLKPRPGDIYVATAMKAGTTLAQMILYQLATGGRGEFEHILQVSPYYEDLPAKPEAIKVLDAQPSPRIIKTHLSYNELRPPRDSKVVYVTRNAADSVISLYHHACLAEGFNLDFDSFVLAQLRPGGRGWYSHLASWWPHRKDPNVLHVRYEDLMRDLEGQIRRIAAFCEIPIDESCMGAILEKCSFKYMKENDVKFDFRLRFFGKEGPRSGFIRKGGVGSDRNRLTAAHQAKLEALMATAREKLGLSDNEL